MSQTYIKRSLEPILKKASSEFPAVVLTGPRQSGKTALFQHLFSKSCQYVSLEPPDVRASAIEDPRSFLEMYPPPVIFDEVQYAPNLLPYISDCGLCCASRRYNPSAYFRYNCPAIF